MTQQQHPITPPRELVQQWRKKGYGLPDTIFFEYVANCSAQWGFDQAKADIETAAGGWVMTDITRNFAWALTQVLGGVKEHDLTDQFGIPEDECAKVMSLLAQARAYLDRPEPEGPTDEELLAAQDQAVASFPPVHPEVKPLSAVEYARELEIRKARAVLARWGRSLLKTLSDPSSESDFNAHD
jgi:hypothetical protein